MQQTLYLSNLDSKRDWGHAQDYVRAMWLMLQQDTPDDYVIATDETHNVREFVETAFRELHYPLEWSGTGVDEIGRDARNGQVLMRIDPRYFRPTEVGVPISPSGLARTHRLAHRPQNHL